MITGFSTERTAEYIVLHDLYERIKSHSSFFYPFFYQRNRDDTKLSLENKLEGLHLIICFARRTKTYSSDAAYSAITFRSSLFEQTNYFSALGVATIVGAPTGTSIAQIGFGCTCRWFQLYPSHDENYITWEFVDGIPYAPPGNHISILSDSGLLELLDQAPKFSWIEVLSIIREWNHMYKMTHPTALFNSIPGQKPVFIVYK